MSNRPSNTTVAPIPWDEMEIIDDWNFRLTFFTNGENYISEIWWRHDEESFDAAGLRICRRYDWPDPAWSSQ